MTAILRKYGVEATINFTLFEVDGIDFRVDAVHASGDSAIMKDEGAEANTSNSFADEGNGYSLVLTATEMQAARIVIYLVDQTATKIWLDSRVIVETYGNASAQHAFDLGTASTAQTADHTSAIADIPTVAEFNARTLLAASYFDPTADAVANVTLVATTTTNTDMRGTNSANTTTPLSAAGTRTALGLASANMDTQFSASVTATGFNTVVPDAAGVAPTAVEIRQEMDANSIDLNTLISGQSTINSNVLLIDTAAMRGTDGANTTTPPTVAAISTQVWSETTRTLTAFSFTVDCDVKQINGATVIGLGTSGNLWRA